MKNIIITGSLRAGKSTLAKKINQELGFFVISTDKLVAIFGEAYPHLDIRLAWDREKTTDNIAPFLGHFLGMFSSPDGRGLLQYSHGVAGSNRFVLEGCYMGFEKILPILRLYGIEEIKNSFLLIGLVQGKKTVNDYISDFVKYDTRDDWTYGLNPDDLRNVSEDAFSYNRFMTDYLKKYDFMIYDTSMEREQVLDRIVADIKLKLS